jgi:HlyD family secretion protein
MTFKKLNKKTLVFIISLIIALIGVIIFIKIKNNNHQVKYILTKVSRGNINSIVSGSGEIIANNQVTLNPKASGTVVYIGVKNGQFVNKGKLIVKLDTTDAEKAVRNAEINLENAKLNLEKAKQANPIDETILKRQAMAAMTNTLSDTKTVLNSLNDILFTDISGYHINSNYLIDYYSHIVNFYHPEDIDYDTVITNNYNKLKTLNTSNQAIISYLNDNSSFSEVKNALDKITDTTKLLNDTVQLSYQLINRYDSVLKDNNLTPAIAIRNILTDKSTLASYLSLVNTDTTTLLNLQNSFANYLNNANNPVTFNLRVLELNVEQAQNALDNAKDNLNNYYVYAPFDGIVSQLNINVGDNININTPVCVLITKDKIAKITLTEVDLAKIKLGDKAQLTFDALPDFKTTGQVIEIDPLGVESQGVVSYTVKISLDKIDERLNPGMSVNADIITDSKENVLLLNNSAIKSINNKKYVELVTIKDVSEETFKSGISLSNNVIKKQFIETGLSDDDNTEIISGLNEGDVVVLRIINSVSNKTTNTTKSMFTPNFNPQTQRGFR